MKLSIASMLAPAARPTAAMDAFRSAPSRALSVLDVADILGTSTRSANGLCVCLAREGHIRPTGMRDARGWPIFALPDPKPVPAYVINRVRRDYAEKNRLRGLVATGVLPVERAAAALGIQRSA